MCISIFKDGSTVTTKEKFTQAWIDLINSLEKDRQLCYTSDEHILS